MRVEAMVAGAISFEAVLWLLWVQGKRLVRRSRSSLVSLWWSGFRTRPGGGCLVFVFAGVRARVETWLGGGFGMCSARVPDRRVCWVLAAGGELACVIVQH